MNKSKRMKNAENFRLLRKLRIKREAAEHTCEECGEKGYHWVQVGYPTLEVIINSEKDKKPIDPNDYGFWTCAKFYGPDGKRLPEHHAKSMQVADSMLEAALLTALAAVKRKDAPPIVEDKSLN